VIDLHLLPSESSQLVSKAPAEANSRSWSGLSDDGNGGSSELGLRVGELAFRSERENGCLSLVVHSRNLVSSVRSPLDRLEGLLHWKFKHLLLGVPVCYHCSVVVARRHQQLGVVVRPRGT